MLEGGALLRKRQHSALDQPEEVALRCMLLDKNNVCTLAAEAARRMSAGLLVWAADQPRVLTTFWCASSRVRANSWRHAAWCSVSDTIFRATWALRIAVSGAAVAHGNANLLPVSSAWKTRAHAPAPMGRTMLKVASKTGELDIARKKMVVAVAARERWAAQGYARMAQLGLPARARL